MHRFYFAHRTDGVRVEPGPTRGYGHHPRVGHFDDLPPIDVDRGEEPLDGGGHVRRAPSDVKTIDLDEPSGLLVIATEVPHRSGDTTERVEIGNSTLSKPLLHARIVQCRFDRSV